MFAREARKQLKSELYANVLTLSLEKPVGGEKKQNKYFPLSLTVNITAVQLWFHRVLSSSPPGHNSCSCRLQGGILPKMQPCCVALKVNKWKKKNKKQNLKSRISVWRLALLKLHCFHLESCRLWHLHWCQLANLSPREVGYENLIFIFVHIFTFTQCFSSDLGPFFACQTY